jgi:thioredoxin-dependent peroxiredoxin
MASDRNLFLSGALLGGNRHMKNLEGQRAPGFSLEGNDGKKYSLEDYRGKTVVLYFYPKDDTPGWTKEACGFRELVPGWKRSGTVVLGVSRDSMASHQKFAEKFKLPFVLLSDPRMEVMKQYGAWGKKMMYGKTVEGTIRSTVIIGPKGDVLKHWPIVKKAGDHPQEVMEFLKATHERPAWVAAVAAPYGL